MTVSLIRSKEIKKGPTIVYECQFRAQLKLPENKYFVDQILPNLKKFSRLVPRDAISSGIRQTFCHRWLKDEHPNRSLFFIDINGSYHHVCASYEFPYGKCSILIDEQIEDVVNRILRFRKKENKEIDEQIEGIVADEAEDTPVEMVGRAGYRR